MVNIGDCMMSWTTDIHVLTPRRVPPTKFLIGAAEMFLDLDPSQAAREVSATGPQNCLGMRATEYMAARLVAAYASEEAR